MVLCVFPPDSFASSLPGKLNAINKVSLTSVGLIVSRSVKSEHFMHKVISDSLETFWVSDGFVRET